MRPGRILPFVALALVGCNAPEPIAYGPERDIAAATQAARLCGMVEIRHEPLSDGESMLLIGSRNTADSVSCTRRWFREHAPQIELTPERARVLGF